MSLPKLEDVPEAGPVGDGIYQLKIVGAKEKVSETSGNEYLMATMAIPEEPDSEIFNEILVYPKGDDENEDKRRLRPLKKFCKCFDIPEDGVEPSEIVGAEGQAKLKVVQDFFDPDRYVNKVKTYM